MIQIFYWELKSFQGFLYKMQKWTLITAMDGISDLYQARNNKWGFSIWAVIMTSMISLCCYSMTNTVVGYIRSPTVTIITTVPKVSIPVPDMLLCYMGGYNVLKMKHEMGLSDELIRSFTKNHDSYCYGEPIVELYNEWKTYLTKHKMDMKQFFEEVSFQCEDIIDIVENVENPCRNVSVKFVEYYMPASCLLLQENRPQKWPGATGGLQLKLREPIGSHHQFYPDLLSRGFELDFSKKYVAPPLKPVQIPASIVASIALKATHHKRLRNCFPAEKKTSSSNDCYRLCYKTAMNRFCHCCLAADQTSKAETICSVDHYMDCISKKYEAIDNDQANCTSLCLPSCDEWEYDYTMSFFGFGTNTTSISVGFNTLQYIKVS